MSEGTTPDFIVCADSDPVLVRINGKANYLNCSPINDFFDHVILENKFSFAIDFEHCLGMDSTFLGVLAGVATKALQQTPQGSVMLANLSQQNKQLIRGLGLHHLPTVKIQDDVDLNQTVSGGCTKIDGLKVDEKEASPEMILEAHERLMKLNRANERRFQDVVKFLRREADKKSNETND